MPSAVDALGDILREQSTSTPARTSVSGAVAALGDILNEQNPVPSGDIIGGYPVIGINSSAPQHFDSHLGGGVYDITKRTAKKLGKSFAEIATDLAGQGFVVAVRTKGERDIFSNHIHFADPQLAPKEATRLQKQRTAGNSSIYVPGQDWTTDLTKGTPGVVETMREANVTRAVNAIKPKPAKKPSAVEEFGRLLAEQPPAPVEESMRTPLEVVNPRLGTRVMEAAGLQAPDVTEIPDQTPTIGVPGRSAKLSEIARYAVENQLSTEEYKYLTRDIPLVSEEQKNSAYEQAQTDVYNALQAKNTDAGTAIWNIGTKQVPQILGGVGEALSGALAENAPAPLQTEKAQKNIRSAGAMAPIVALTMVPGGGTAYGLSFLGSMLNKEPTGANGEQQFAGVEMAKGMFQRLAHPLTAIKEGEAVQLVMDGLIMVGVGKDVWKHTGGKLQDAQTQALYKDAYAKFGNGAFEAGTQDLIGAMKRSKEYRNAGSEEQAGLESAVREGVSVLKAEHDKLNAWAGEDTQPATPIEPARPAVAHTKPYEVPQESLQLKAGKSSGETVPMFSKAETQTGGAKPEFGKPEAVSRKAGAKPKAKKEQATLIEEPLPVTGGTEAAASGGNYKRPEAGTAPLTGAKPSRNVDITTDAVRLQGPELVKLFKDLTDEYPVVKKQLRALNGTARGVFHTGPTPGIELRANIFLGDQVARFSAKLGKENVKEERAANIERIQGEVAAKNGWDVDDVVVRYSRDNRGRDVYDVYHVNPDLSSQVISHEIGHYVDYIPDNTLTRGNILGHLAGFKKYMKHTVEATPLGKDLALTGRGPIKRAQVMEELKLLSEIWKPFDVKADPKYTSYRHKPAELYADMVSVLFNEPGLFESVAPTAHELFMNYLEKKPAFKAEYKKLQDMYTNPEAMMDSRISDLHEMFKRGDEAHEKSIVDNQGKAERVIDTLMKGLVDENWAVLKTTNAAEKSGGAKAEIARAARFGLEEARYLDGRVDDLYNHMDRTLFKQMVDSSVGYADLAEELYLRRVQADRKHLANPLNYNPSTGAETLAALHSRWGKTKTDAVDTILNDWRYIRDTVIDEVASSGLYSKDVMDMIRKSNGEDYAKFSVTKYLDKRYGGDVSARIHHQIGTLSEIENPFVATVLQDVAMLRSAKMNMVKADLVKHLESIGGLQPAEMRYSLDIKGRKPVDPKDPTMGILTVMEEGKPAHYYVAKEVADMFQYDPVKAQQMVQWWGTVSGVMRDILVSKNPVWQARNIVRDLSGTIKNVEQVAIKDIPKLIKIYKEAYHEVVAEVFKGERSADLSQALNEFAIPSGRMYSPKDVTYQNTIERFNNEFVTKFNPYESPNAAMELLRGAYNTLDKTGRISEVTGKLAGYKFLKKYHPEMDVRQRAHSVRNLVGTPDFKTRGAWHAFTNNVFMFSNINKQGVRSAIEAFKSNPSRYMWKTFTFNVAPKLINLAIRTYAGSSLVGQVLNKIDEYDQRMYTVIPIGLTNGGKDAYYLRIPNDYEGTAVGAAIYDALQGKIFGKDGAINTIAEQNPYKLHPLLAVGKKLADYYVLGINPVDTYRGRSVLTDQEYKAGGMDAAKAISRYAWNNLGGSNIYRMKTGVEIITDESELQKALRLPGINVLGAFLRVNHNGETSDAYDAAARSERRVSKRQIERKKAIADAINSGESASDAYNRLVSEDIVDPKTTSENEFTRNYSKKTIKTTGNAWADKIVNSTNEVRADMLAEYARTHSQAEYNALVSDLEDSGAIPGETLNKLTGTPNERPHARTAGSRPARKEKARPNARTL